MLEHSAGSDTTILIDPERGGRLASVQLSGVELLVPAPELDQVENETDPLRWGSYPMAPFAGRISSGRFHFDGRDHELPATLGPHAIHGYSHLSPWEVVDDVTLRYDFEPPVALRRARHAALLSPS